MIRRLNARVVGLVLVLALVALAGCSGGDDDGSATDAPGSAQPSSATNASDATTGPEAPEGSETAGGDAASSGPVATASPTTAPPEPDPGGTITLGMSSEPNTLDPIGAANSAALSVFNAVADTLMRRDPVTDEPVPHLAASLTESDDRLSWTLVLNDGITFHDGTPLDAEAVRFNLERHRGSLVTATLVAPMVELEVVDATTLVINLDAPWVALPAVLAASPGIMISPASVAELGDDLPNNLVGTGPYRLAEWDRDVSLTLTPNPDFWDAEHPPLLDEIVMRPIGDDAGRRAAFEADEVDCFNVGQADINDLREQGDAGEIRFVEVVGIPIMNLFNNATAPFDDPRMRRALVHATDSQTLVEALAGGTGIVANGPFPPSSPWHVVDTGYPTFDPEEARRLVEEYTAETGSAPAFTYQTPSTDSLLELATALEQMWEDVGFDVTLNTALDQTTLILNVITGNYEMSIWQLQDFADPDVLLYNYFHSTGSLNFEKYSNPAVDVALDEGRTNPDRDARVDAYTDAIRGIAADVPVTFGTFLITGLACTTGVAGIDPGAIHGLQFPARDMFRTTSG
jgi:peptide/nickel transport system substrate-binding protein